jgi:hypothetical protein
VEPNDCSTWNFLEKVSFTHISFLGFVTNYDDKSKR